MLTQACACRALLATHPEVQAKAAAELEAAGLLATKARPEPRRLSYADLGRLPYLNAVRRHLHLAISHTQDSLFLAPHSWGGCVQCLSWLVVLTQGLQID